VDGHRKDTVLDDHTKDTLRDGNRKDTQVDGNRNDILVDGHRKDTLVDGNRKGTLVHDMYPIGKTHHVCNTQGAYNRKDVCNRNDTLTNECKNRGNSYGLPGCCTRVIPASLGFPLSVFNRNFTHTTCVIDKTHFE